MMYILPVNATHQQNACQKSVAVHQGKRRAMRTNCSKYLAQDSLDWLGNDCGRMPRASHSTQSREPAAVTPARWFQL